MSVKKLRIKYKKTRTKFKLFIRVDKSNFKYEMTKVADQIFYIGQIKAEAEYELSKAETKLKMAKAKADKKIRLSCIGKKKITDKEAEHQVRLNKNVVKAAELYADKKYKLELCWGAFTAITHKSQQLTNMSNNYRKEMDAGIRTKIKAKQAADKMKNF